MRCLRSTNMRGGYTVSSRCPRHQLNLWPPNVGLLLTPTLTSFASACVAKACSTNTCHGITAFTARHNHMTIGTGPRMLPKPAHQSIILVSDAPQVLQVVRMLVFLIAIELPFAEETFKILLPQGVRTALRWALDAHLLIV